MKKLNNLSDLKVLVIGSSSGNAGSMDRYSSLLIRSYKEIGVSVQVARPTNLMSRYMPLGTLRKYTKYIESLILFPLYLTFKSIGKVVHFADHSDTLLMPWTVLSTRKVATCHDLIAVRAALGEIPEYRPKVLGTLYQKLVLRGLSKADSVAAVSEATAEDVARLVPKASSYILLNPLDIDLAVPIKTAHVGSPYFLIVSHSSWRKGRDDSIGVWVQLRELEEFRKSKLILVGTPLTAAENLELADVPADQIEVRNAIKDSELSGLYAGCVALIQMSRYEGFGWPVIEVNAQDRPAICSDIKVFHEIGEHNVFVSDKKPFGQIVAELERFPGVTVGIGVREKFSERNFRNQLLDLLLKTVNQR